MITKNKPGRTFFRYHCNECGNDTWLADGKEKFLYCSHCCQSALQCTDVHQFTPEADGKKMLAALNFTLAVLEQPSTRSCRKHFPILNGDLTLIEETAKRAIGGAL